MLKYIPEDVSVVFSEIPDQICLAINISGCPHKCPECHSPYLRDDIGDFLTFSTIDFLVEKNNGVTCVLLMGGDADKNYLRKLALHINSLCLLVGWYSGEDYLDLDFYKKYFDYIKVGSYKKELGPLNSKTTNQRLYRIISRENIEDITCRFWK